MLSHFFPVIKDSVKHKRCFWRDSSERHSAKGAEPQSTIAAGARSISSPSQPRRDSRASSDPSLAPLARWVTPSDTSANQMGLGIFSSLPPGGKDGEMAAGPWQLSDPTAWKSLGVVGHGSNKSVELPDWSPRVSRDPALVSRRAFHPCPGCPGAGHGPASLTWWVCRTVRMMKSLAFL